jgi:hypothetical protein
MDKVHWLDCGLLEVSCLCLSPISEANSFGITSGLDIGFLQFPETQQQPLMGIAILEHEGEKIITRWVPGANQ